MNATETLELLLRKTEENGHTIVAIFPDEPEDFIRGYTAGQIDAFRLALEHLKDMEENQFYEKRQPSRGRRTKPKRRLET